MIHQNLQTLRKLHHLTQEEVAEHVQVSRQAVAKWENGETTPDITNCIALAELYNVSIDDLVKHEDEYGGAMIAPKGKHFFGSVTMNERGQIVIPKKARDVFHLNPGDSLLFLGDEEQGMALIKADGFIHAITRVSNMLKRGNKDSED